MPLPDNEPQYWLRDSNGNLVGAFYLDADGNPAIVDENGNEASLESDGTWDVPGVSTDAINSGRSGRFGDYVYYDPADSGPYVDGADALTDVPDGGTLLLAAGEYDPATEGVLHTERGVSVLGVGASQDNTGAAYGTKIFNTGADAIDQPVVKVSDPEGRAGGPVEVGRFQLRHEGATTAGVLISDQTFGYVHDIVANNQGIGEAAVRYDNGAFFAVCERVSESDSTVAGIDVQSGGSANIVRDCQTNTGGNAGAVGCRLGTTAHVVGGQHEGEAAGVQFDNQTAGPVVQGSVTGTVFEATAPAIDITGANEWQGVDLYRPYFDLNTDETAVRFDQASSCRLRYPLFNYSSNSLVDFTANQTRCGVIVEHNEVATDGFSAGGTQPWAYVPQIIGSFPISQLPTDVPISVMGDSNRDNSPVWHDGTNWRVASSTTYTP